MRLNPLRDEDKAFFRKNMYSLKHINLLLVHLAIYGFFLAISGTGLGLKQLLLGVLLIWASYVDIRRFEIPDLASFGLIMSGVVSAASNDAANGLYVSLMSSVLWAGLFWTTSFVAKFAIGKDALGLGDAKLMGGVGAWLGPVLPIYVVLSASIAAIATILFCAGLKGEDVRGKAVAFGPYLCLSAWVIWLNGMLL